MSQKDNFDSYYKGYQKDTGFWPSGWETWQAAQAEQAEQLTIAKQRISELEKDCDILQTNLDAALAKIKGFEALVKLIKHHYKIDDKNPLYITTGLLEGAETK